VQISVFQNHLNHHNMSDLSELTVPTRHMRSSRAPTNGHRSTCILRRCIHLELAT